MHRTVNPVLAVATRSGEIESWHRGALAVWHDDRRAVAIGDVDTPVFARSATKPLQALPFLELGLAERLALPDAEIAVMCASHDGTERHVAAVRSLLQRGGLHEAQLGCGPHAPFDPDSRRALAVAGIRAARVHNNCSGKHTGFLLLAHHLGADLGSYLEPDSQGQQRIHDAVAAMAGVDGRIPVGLDGCGAPTFRLSLAALARAFGRLANPDGLGPVRATACRTILTAVGREPFYLAGERRFCTALVRTWPGRCFAKNGAEGVYAIGLCPDPARRRWPGGLGIAVKIDDGNERGYQPVIVEALLRLCAFPDDQVPPALVPFWRQPLLNTQKRPVGEVRSSMEWPV